MAKDDNDLVACGDYQQFSNPPAYAPGYNEVQTIPNQQVLVEVTGAVPVGPDAMRIKCQGCKAQVTTTIESKFTSKTHWTAFFLCLCLCWLCCCCPYCCGCYKEVRHTCPNCKNYIGSYWGH